VLSDNPSAANFEEIELPEKLFLSSDSRIDSVSSLENETPAFS